MPVKQRCVTRIYSYLHHAHILILKPLMMMRLPADRNHFICSMRERWSKAYDNPSAAATQEVATGERKI